MKIKLIIITFTILSLLFILLLASFIYRIGGAHIPSNYELVNNPDLCVGFSGNSGSGEFVYVFTYKCENLNSMNEIFNNKDYIDIDGTIECPIFDYFDNGNKIVITQDWLCDQFAHVEEYEPCEQILLIDENGIITSETSFQCNRLKGYLGF